jgi:hypothetical protein
MSETWGYLIWSRLSDCDDHNQMPCATGCKPYYPDAQPEYVGQVVMSECGCGCGNCGYLRIENGVVQIAGCADWQDCECFATPNANQMEPGELAIGPCELI